MRLGHKIRVTGKSECCKKIVWPPFDWRRVEDFAGCRAVLTSSTITDALKSYDLSGSAFDRVSNVPIGVELVSLRGVALPA
jgi:hypothetical protein